MRVFAVHAAAVAVLSVTMFAGTPDPARAGARLHQVVSTNGGCVAGPAGTSLDTWAVAPGFTYALTIDQVTDCANSGTNPTLQVLVRNSLNGNQFVAASKVTTGIYRFNFTMPPASRNGCTYPILYCTVGSNPGSGSPVTAYTAGASQARLRAAAFGPRCSQPVPYASCTLTPARSSTWGVVRSIYR